MADRYVDYVDNNKDLKEREITFKWCFGFSKPQMQKSVRNLHKKFKETIGNDSMKMLEVSSASDNPLGTEASAFNLNVKTTHGTYKVEQLFQAGKIFLHHGSMQDSLKLSPKEAKRASFKINRDDQLIKFGLFGSEFPLTPKTFFYDWIYLHGLEQNRSIARQLLNYDAFTDIYATPKRTVNSQAKSCAIFVSLYRMYGAKKVKNLLEPKNKDRFKNLVYVIHKFIK